MNIRPFNPSDFPKVKEIYQLGIDTKQATFETEAPGWEEWDKKFLQPFRLVALADNTIAGWAALSQVSTRQVYAGVCEVTVYVHPDFYRQGIGKQLLSSLIGLGEQNNIWTLQASIFPENTASIHLHKDLGFREVGYREKIAQRDNVWRDTILLERRSKLI